MKIQLKKSTRNLLIALIIFMTLTTIVRLCIITFGNWYDKGKYFLCETHATKFLNAPKEFGIKNVEIEKRPSDSDYVRINFEEFTIKGETNSYLISFIFGGPIGLNDRRVVIDDGDISLITYSEAEFEFPFTEAIDKEQKENLIDNYKEAIEWACDTELRIIIVRFVVLGVLMYVVIKAGKSGKSGAQKK